MSIFTKLLEPIFETNKETQSAFENRFNKFYESDSFNWTSRPFRYLHGSESQKLLSLYTKLTPFFEGTGLVRIEGRKFSFIRKDIFEQRIDTQSQNESDLDISSAPCFRWMNMGSEKKKNLILSEEYAIKDAGKFSILVFKLSSDFALFIVTAQADPWLKVKLDAFKEQIILGYCDNE